MIAADVNKSGSITAFDMVELRKLILYINTEFPDNTSWRFVPTTFDFANPANPFAASFPEAYNVNNLTADMQADFVAIKVGDVNDSARPNQLIGSEDRNAVGDLNFVTEDIDMVAGETYTVNIAADNFAAVAGYQFTMNFDAELVGVLTTSWNSDKGVDAEGTIFTVTLRAKRAARLSDVMNLSSDYTAAEAYTSNADFLNVNLTFNGAAQTEEFALYQNVPNPFKNETVVGFVLPEAMPATITIYDVAGKVLRLVEGEYSKGYNEVSVNRSDLSGAGVLYYTLETADDSATKKMIIIE